MEAAGGSPGSVVRSTPRSLVLITIDCLRADHVGFLGYSDPTTPFLDSLASESFVFENAIASGVPTYYSLPALFASRYPLALGRDVVGIAPGENTIATELKECGFKTAAFIAANPYISTAQGYDAGFDVFNDFLDSEAEQFGFSEEDDSPSRMRTGVNRLLAKTCHSLPVLGAAYDELYFRYCQTTSADGASLDGLRKFPSADVIVDCATAWLDDHASGPFFLWLHLMDPHAPYYPKVEALREMGCDHVNGTHGRHLNSYWTRSDLGLERLRVKKREILNLYDAGIRWADLQIRRLVQKLRDLKVWNECAVAVTADHGEEFLDHGGRLHSPNSLHNELTHVPLLLRVPGHIQHRNISAPIGLIDLAPTLLDAFELSSPASFRGRSCWQELVHDQSWEWPVVTECIYGCNNPFQVERRSAPRLLAIRKAQFKLIVNFALGTEELFDLASDPAELNPLPAGTADEQRKSLLECARKHIEQASKSRDFDLRLGAQIRELCQRWQQSSVGMLS
jgi:arylsulfatase A-like enzyme